MARHLEKPIALVGVLFLVIVAGPAAAQATGASAVVRYCATCHGLDGAGRDAETPNIAGQSGIYLRRQLDAFRSGRRRHPLMQRNVESLTEREIGQIVTHFSLLPAR